MKLTRLDGSCPDGVTCPTIFETDRDTVVVQGYTLTAEELAQLTLPDGEGAVEIPMSLLRKVADAAR